MKKNNHLYSEISSFEDFQKEKEKLMLKRQLIEAKISLNFLKLTQSFSIGNLLISAGKEFILPKLSSLLGSFLKKDPIN